MPKPVYKRVMLKISGEVLEGDKGSGVDIKVLDALCKEIAEVKKLGVELVVTVGGGNFWRSRDFMESGMDRVHSDYVGMLATVMNSMVLQHGFEKAGVEAVALSSVPMEPVVGTYMRDKALCYLKKGKIVICAAGTGNAFFTTDSAAALRARDLSCDVMLKATKVDFVYDKDPVKFPNAKKYTKLSYQQLFRDELGVMDMSAVDLCASGKLPIIVFNLKVRGNIKRAVMGEKVGTLIN